MGGPFSPLELDKLSEFRLKVQDAIDPDKLHDDYFLIRWLRARHLDIPKAEEMLRKSLKWRADNNVDGVVERETIPDRYKKLFPFGVFGTDFEDNPIIIFPLGRYDHRVFIEEQGLPQVLRYNIIWVERIMQILRDFEKASGKRGLKLVELVDMEFYSYRDLIYKPGLEFITMSQKTFDENYPEMLKSVVVVNAPKIFAVLFGVVKPMLSKETLEKVDIYGSDEETWKALVQQRFNLDKLPIRWGGNLKGSDPFCSQDLQVWPDGPIPLDYFARGQPDLSGFTKTKVGPRDKFRLEYEIKTSQVELKWKFKTDNHDIGFQLTAPNGQVLVPLSRTDSQTTISEGSIECEHVGTYIFIFDNTFSYTKSKTLYYLIQVGEENMEDIDLNFE